MRRIYTPVPNCSCVSESAANDMEGMRVLRSDKNVCVFRIDCVTKETAAAVDFGLPFCFEYYSTSTNPAQLNGVHYAMVAEFDEMVGAYLAREREPTGLLRSARYRFHVNAESVRMKPLDRSQT